MDKPTGITITSTTLCRFHAQEYLYGDPPSFIDTFLDRAHQSIGQYRFAGAQLNPGTYFALDAQTAIDEFAHYRGESLRGSTPGDVLDRVRRLRDRDFIFITCVGSFEGVLDLLDSATVDVVLEQCYRERIVGGHSGRSIHMATFIDAVASSNEGGNDLTDRIGLYAWRNGYSGVRFPSARALDCDPSVRAPGSASTRASLRGLHWGADWRLAELRQQINIDMSNLVIFRGTDVIRGVCRFRVERAGGIVSDWIENAYANREGQDIEDECVRRGGVEWREIEELCCGILTEGWLEIRSSGLDLRRELPGTAGA